MRAFERGWDCATQDLIENVPFASIGGLEQRHDPQVPDYISQEDSKEWLEGYIASSRNQFGEDWLIVQFNWTFALNIKENDTSSVDMK